MASEFSFDVVSQFDLQEIRNAVDQVNRELANRFDFKGIFYEITLKEKDNLVEIVAAGESKAKAIYDILLQKVINRKQSPKILDQQDPEKMGGENVKIVVKLVKELSSDKCKIVTQLIRDNFKAKPSINSNAVRVASKDKDELQAIMKYLQQQEAKIGLPVSFQNFR